MYLENYQALLACILNSKLSVDKAIHMIIGQKNKIYSNKKQFKVVDIKLNKEYTGDAQEIRDFIQECSCNVSKYAMEGKLYKNRYKMFYI